MKLPKCFARWLERKFSTRTHFAPDLVLHNAEAVYLCRWCIIPRNPILNIYLHQFQGDDDDRALHDHPWWSLSLMLRGVLFEETIRAGGVHRWRVITTGQLRFRFARFAHRLKIEEDPREFPMTLFITGPRFRRWGFHCPNGWVDFGAFKIFDGCGPGD